MGNFTMGNTNLHAAKAAKNDEFYTTYRDVESEMMGYFYYDRDVFRDKIILLPCDDPEESNFTKFFADRFDFFGMKKLISTSYVGNKDGQTRGRIFTLERDENHDSKITRDDITWKDLKGDGDFRSEEVTALRDEADIVATNPPFSLFREFVAWLEEGDVLYSILGNMNAITYKEIFPLIKDKKMWLGGNNGAMWFDIPDDAPKKANQQTLENGTRQQKFGNINWYTNIDHGERHEYILYMTMDDNRRFSPHKKIREEGYPKYDNYDAIEVAFSGALPSDYEGIMGVPISFLDKLNPDRFEILGCSYNYGRPAEWPSDTVMSPSVDGHNIYKRIFIRNLKPGKDAQL